MTDLSEAPLFQAKALPRPKAAERYSPKQRSGGAAYRAARRHSVLVRSLRYILPILAIVGLAVFRWTVRFVPGDRSSLVNVAGVDVNSNSVIMQNPRLSGFDGTRRAYDVTAGTAKQNLDDPKIIALSAIVGHFGLNGGGTATVQATSGIYNGNDGALSLTDGIAASTTAGYTAKLIDAAVDIRTGKLVTEKPVALNTGNLTIKANTMTVLDSGKHVLFGGGVAVTYLPPENGVVSGAAPPQ